METRLVTWQHPFSDLSELNWGENHPCSTRQGKPFGDAIESTTCELRTIVHSPTGCRLPVCTEAAHHNGPWVSTLKRWQSNKSHSKIIPAKAPRSKLDGRMLPCATAGCNWDKKEIALEQLMAQLKSNSLTHGDLSYGNLSRALLCYIYSLAISSHLCNP